MTHAMVRSLEAAARGAVPGTWHGRGIVVCAGGVQLFTSLYVLLRLLRETLTCRLPIDVWHMGSAELSPAMRALLQPLGVTLVDAATVLTAYPADIRDGWQLKAYALLHSRFSEVLLLDADQVPVSDPSALFEWREFRDKGAVFWPDVCDLGRSNPIWDLVGIEGADCVSWESGQILVDKTRHYSTLAVALKLCEAADITWKLIYGDKDSFLVAWRYTGADVAVVPHRPYQDRYMLIQRDFTGRSLFQHRTNCKWQLGAAPYVVDGEVWAPECHGYLADLSRRWNGRHFDPPDRSLRAREMEHVMMQAGPLRLARPLSTEPDVMLELLAGSQIGAGRCPDIQNWYVVEVGGELVLTLSDGRNRRCEFRHSRKGWTALDTPPVWIIRSDGPPESATGRAATGIVAAIADASGVDLDADPTAQAELIAALRLLIRADAGFAAAVSALGLRSDAWKAIADAALRGLNGPPPPPPKTPDVLARYYTRPDTNPEGQ